MSDLVRIVFLSFLFSSCFLGCSRMEVEKREDAMRFHGVNSLKELGGDFVQKETLLQTAMRLKEKPFGESLQFGPCQINTQDYAQFLINLAPDSEVALFEVYGKEEWGEILLTSYFSPVYEARKSPQGEFIQPVYAIPDDLVEVKMDDFSHRDLLDQEVGRTVVSGRMVDGPGSLKRIVPFYSRSDIDMGGALKGKNLELAYMKPIDAFVLQIQGSGQLTFPGGEVIELGYGAQNGHRYYSIGKSLLDIIPKEEMSLAKIKDYLEGLEREKLYEFLSLNPSYVFFKPMKKKKGLTTFGLEPAPMETLAIDYRLFPLGALAYLEYPHPKVSETEVIFEDKGRFVFAHDTGGAIKGGGRADLYWGSGEMAEKAAGLMRHPSRLYFIAPKSCVN